RATARAPRGRTPGARMGPPAPQLGDHGPALPRSLLAAQPTLRSPSGPRPNLERARSVTHMAPVRVDLIVGARPNFVKAAPLVRALGQYPDEFAVRLVHTGQHYDADMSDGFFRDLELPRPDVHLEVGAGTPGAPTGAI